MVLATNQEVKWNQYVAEAEIEKDLIQYNMAQKGRNLTKIDE